MTVEDTSLAAQKDKLRRDVLKRRGELDPVIRVEASLALADFADDLDLPAGAMVAGFWPIRDEIDPRPLMDALRRRGLRLCLPIVSDPHLIFRELNRDSEMESAGFGTFGPGPASPEVRPDVLLMPLAAFDDRGNRIGYGKGHYDITIAALEQQGGITCIGLAYCVQEVGPIPAEPHDKRLDGILTEAGFRRFESQGRS
ncbi:5-formyltetrahydrofolate cyclo-ligase [Roseibium sp.]|uniref:5-formyltetrahydrofolate cyclo-ligase n=1 Tax=Roseibium sp. TaxID=1936156 RepID=UPI003A972E30